MNNVNSFHMIRVLTRCEICLHQGGSYAVHVDEPDDIAQWIDYYVENGELIIQTKPIHYGFLLLSGSYPKMIVECTNLTCIQICDRAFVTTKEEFQVEKLGIIVYQGRIELDINAVLTDCTVLKRAMAKIRGSTIVSQVLVHQHGVYHGDEFDASEAYIHLHGDGQASVWATEELEASLFSRSKLQYHGIPSMRLIHIDEGCSIKPFDRSGFTKHED